MTKAKLESFIYLGLAWVTVSGFWPVPGHGFISYDDPDYVTATPQLPAGLSKQGMVWTFGAWTPTHAGNWHPAIWFSHRLDCQLIGTRPSGHHLINLLFHAANTLLLFGVFKRMTGAT